MTDIDTIIQAAVSGGKVVSKYFGKALVIEEKSTASDFRTKADLESEKEILSILKKEFPDYNIFSEESGTVDNKSEYTFVIDPLDGSNNSVLGIPNFAVSIGLLKGDKVVAGVIHQPIINETYRAERGKGAFMKGNRLKVSKESDIKKATLSYTCGYINSAKYEEELIHNLRKMDIKRLMQNWCPSHEYCLLASGRIEGIINNDNEIYDYCAGRIIATEAGGKITDFKGNEVLDEKSSIFLATNGTQLHENLLRIL